MRASLLSLQGAKKSIDRTQERLATGRKVNSALDNPTNFFAAVSHMNLASDLIARKDGINEAIRTIAAANNGISAITSLLNTAKGLANAAISTNDQTLRTTYSKSYDEMLSQVDTLAIDSSYRGSNLLANQTLNVEFSGTSGQSTLGITGVDVSVAGLSLDKANSGGTTTTTTTNVGAGNLIATGASIPAFIYLGVDVNPGESITVTQSIASTPGMTPTTWADFGSGRLFDLDLGAGDAISSVTGDSKSITVAVNSAGSGYYFGDNLSVSFGATGHPPVLQRTFGTNLPASDITTLKVGGIAKALGTDYTLATRSSDGLADIVFTPGHAPASGAAITVDTITTLGTNPWTSASHITTSLTQLDSAITDVRTFSDQMSSNSNVLATRLEFTDNMAGILTSGADTLTLADMNEEGANLLMLQTQQNLGTTSLSLASQSAQAIMRLF